MYKNTLQTGLLVASTVCSLTLTGLVVAKEFGLVKPHVQDVSRVSDWRKYAAVGRAIGPDHAAATLIVFSDYQCPYCRGFKGQVDSLSRTFGASLRVVYRHFPLESIHPYARGAAIAAECAADQGRFAGYDSLLFAKQDSLGLIGWAEVAKRAEVPDVAAFARCLDAPGAADRVVRDQGAGAELGIHSTPTVLLNGDHFLQTPTFADLSQRIARLAR